MGGDFGAIFAGFDEGIFLNILEEKHVKSARKIPQISLPTLRTGSQTLKKRLPLK